MCGLVGWFDRGGDARRLADRLARATDRLAHRGPDDRGEFYDGPVGLGFRRLSILDLTASGHQPMTSADGRWTIAYNGEIYNFLEIRDELRRRGVRFRSDGDTEVLLEAIAAWGFGALERMNGMWAFLAWDARDRRLHAARDPWGIKPLYVAAMPSGLAFASEIKALRELEADLGGLDAGAAHDFVARGLLDMDTRTLFANVRRLEPGIVYAHSQHGSDRAEPYADGSARADVPDASDEAAFVEAFRAAFVDSVRIRLRADVDVGTCLSGGLDSTAITGVTGQLLSGERVSVCRHGFTALFPEFDESRYIRALVEERQLSWHVVSASDDVLEAKTRAFFAVHDEPVHSLAALAGFLVMELAAAEGVRVLLNGQGSDELLAGYPSAARYYLRSLLREGHPVRAISEALHEGGHLAGGLRLLGESLAGFVPRPARLRTWRGDSRLLADPLASAPLAPLAPCNDLDTNRELGVFQSPLPLYLRIEDANSSAFSLEARLPFLDPRIVAFARRAPTGLMRRSGLNKYLLRAILPGIVPEIIWRRRDKMGFPVPHARWLRGPLRSLFLEVLDDARLRRRGWYAADRVGSSRDRFLEGAELDPALLRVFLLETWAGITMPV